MMPVELTVLGWSVGLLLAHIALQGAAGTLELGLAHNVSPRDDAQQPKGVVAARLARALRNFLETYPAFVALALALVLAGKAGGSGATGAWLWLAARVIYLPLYAFGVPVVRTLAWALSVAGLLVMLARLLG